jgi:hypothetical protein
VLVTEDPVRVCVKDNPDIEELIEEFDVFRVSCVEVFSWDEAFRPGKGGGASRPGRGGGALRAGRGGVFALFCGKSLSTGGGGKTFFTNVPFGKLFGCFVTEEP